MGCEGMVRVFKIGRGWEGRGSFPHSSFFKTLNFFIYLLLLLFYYFFTKYHFSSHFFPYSTGVAHPQAGLGLGREWGPGPRKCRTSGRGAGLSTMRARLAPRAGGRAGGDGRAGPGHTLGRRERPAAGGPRRGGGMA